ncbi:S-layer homology domain-containing protein [Aminipila sp.]|uniref:S-layer homology domain-containing protein n=1 Tax=Aminipila sp. TaxID=2060095 RepID=UPI002896D7D4|nr:S-layer homology domain-containing protein [Aminipila sp.]
MRKIIVAIFIIASLTATAFASTGYNDVKSSNWAYESVSAMSQKGIVKGYQDGSFKPGNTVTYGEFIKMALIAATGNDVGNSHTGNWALNYYNKAIELGYFTTSDIDSAVLDYGISRQDMALIIAAITNVTPNENLKSNLSDVNNDHNDAIMEAYAAGIITGYNNGTFKPYSLLTRAESATVIYRLVDASKRVLPTPVSYTIKGTAKIQRTKTDYGTEEVREVKLPFRGITKIEKPQKWIRVTSSTEQDIELFNGDGKLIPAVVNADGTWCFLQTDGTYLYLFNAEKVALKDGFLIKFVDDDNAVYKITGVSLK